jgi:hypothetical protein
MTPIQWRQGRVVIAAALAITILLCVFLFGSRSSPLRRRDTMLDYPGWLRGLPFRWALPVFLLSQEALPVFLLSQEHSLSILPFNLHLSGSHH